MYTKNRIFLLLLFAGLAAAPLAAQQDVEEPYEVQRRFHDSIQALPNDSLRLNGYCTKAQKELQRGNYKNAIRLGILGNSLAERMASARQQIRCLFLLGTAYYSTGDMETAGDYFRKAQQLAQKTGDQKTIIVADMNMASVYSEKKEYEKALQLVRASRQKAAAIPDRNIEKKTLTAEGEICFKSGNPEQALALYGKAKEISESIGDKRGTAVLLNNIASVMESLSKHDKALEEYNKAKAIFTEIGDKASLAEVLMNIGHILDEQKKTAEAEKALLSSRALAVETGDPGLQMTTAGTLKEFYRRQNKTEEVQKWARAETSVQDSIVRKQQRMTEQRKQQELDKLKAEKEKLVQKMEERKTTQFSVLIALVLGIIALIGGVVFIVLRLQKNKRLPPQ